MVTRPIFRISRFIPFFLLFLLSSCGIWDSVTAYFNTYYNAKQLFGDAEDELWSQRDVQQLGRNYFLANFTANKTKFEQVIEKCSKLLQYHPESGLVDDALYLIGMSSYYLADYQQADRKFRELLDHSPSKKLGVHAGIMLAYTEYRLPNRDTAAVIAARVYDAAKDDGDDASVAQAAILLGQIEKDRDNREPARKYFSEAGEKAENAELRTTAYLAAARLGEELSDFAGAESSYRAAEKASRTYVGEYRGQLGAARMRARQGDYTTALEQLGELHDNLNYKEFFGEIIYEIGNVYRLSGDLNQAIAEYCYVDTAFARTEFAAKALYQLGLLYETKLQNLDSARVAYTRGKTIGTTGPVGELLAKKADVLTSYVKYRTDLRRLDSTKTAWVSRRDSLIAMRDSLRRAPGPANTATGANSPPAMDSLKKDIAPPLPAQPADTGAVRRDSLSNRAPVQVSPRAAPVTILPNIDSLDQQIAVTRMELATLFYTGMRMPDSAAYLYRALLQDSPDHPSAPRALYTLAQITAQDSTAQRGEADSLYRELVRRFPRTDFADEGRKILGMPAVGRVKGEADSLYSTAVDQMDEGKYPEAVATLRKITTTYPASSVAPRAQYAIGWLYENQLVTPDSAIANYQLLVSRFPASQYVAIVQPKLLAVQSAKTGTAVDTTKTAAPKDTVTVQKPAPMPMPAPSIPGSGRRARQQAPHPGRE